MVVLSSLTLDIPEGILIDCLWNHKGLLDSIVLSADDETWSEWLKERRRLSDSEDAYCEERFEAALEIQKEEDEEEEEDEEIDDEAMNHHDKEYTSSDNNYHRNANSWAEVGPSAEIGERQIHDLEESEIVNACNIKREPPEITNIDPQPPEQQLTGLVTHQPRLVTQQRFMSGSMLNGVYSGASVSSTTKRKRRTTPSSSVKLYAPQFSEGDEAASQLSTIGQTYDSQDWNGRNPETGTRQIDAEGVDVDVPVVENNNKTDDLVNSVDDESDVEHRILNALRHHECPHCSRKFCLLQSLQTHIKVDHATKLVCSQCDLDFTSRRLLAKHARSVHGDEAVADSVSYACVYEGCDKKFKLRRSLHRHVEGFHEGVVHSTCNVCKKTFRRTDYLEAHVRTCHAEASCAKYPCTTCGKLFKDPRRVERHELNVHGNEQRFPCEAQGCKKVFKYSTHVKVHMKHVHGIGGVSRGYRCSQCNMAFHSKRNMERHFKSIHTDLRDFVCGHCSKEFSREDDLKAHILNRHILLDHRPRYNCKQCDKTFSLECNLLRHVRNVHELSRKFVCEICGKSFSQKSDLKRHSLSSKHNPDFQPLSKARKVCQKPEQTGDTQYIDVHVESTEPSDHEPADHEPADHEPKPLELYQLKVVDGELMLGVQEAESPTKDDAKNTSKESQNNAD